MICSTAPTQCLKSTALSSPSQSTQWKSKRAIGSGEIAVKVVKLTDENRESVAREVEYLKLVQGHENVIRFLDGSVKTHKKQLIITELALCNFYQIVAKGGPMQKKMAKHFARQLLEGVDHIHSRGIAHCDLKLENLLLGRDGLLKIADFGLALPYVDFHNNKEGYLEYFGFIGTRTTASPEIIEGISQFAPVKNDIWACGVIIMEFITGFAGLWQQASWEDPAFETFFGGFDSPLEKEEDSFVRFILQIDPRKRPLIFRVLRHHWLQERVTCIPETRKRSLSSSGENNRRKRTKHY